LIVRFNGEFSASSMNGCWKLTTPSRLGAALTGPWRGHWKYRVGDWRIICRIRYEVVTVYVMRVGNRREICD
jgi:mRNA interferase RelE/StbE